MVINYKFLKDTLFIAPSAFAKASADCRTIYIIDIERQKNRFRGKSMAQFKLAVYLNRMFVKTKEVLRIERMYNLLLIYFR